MSQSNGTPNIYFCHYSPETGEILSSGQCPADQLPLQKKNDNFISSSEPVHFETHHVAAGGVLKKYTSGVMEKKKACPSVTHRWSNVSMEWVETRSQEEVQNNKKVNGRGHRDYLLAQSDWTQMPDAPMDAAKRKQWKDYRQALRDVTSQPGFPDNIVWPEPPQ